MPLSSVQSTVILLQILFLQLIRLRTVQSYPILAHVDEDSKRCFRFNIPEDDDANMVFLVLPSEDEVKDDSLERWYVDQVFKLTQKKDDFDRLQKRLPDDAPDDVAKQMSEYLKKKQGNRANVNVALSVNPGPDFEQKAPAGAMQNFGTNYFLPTVVNRVRTTMEHRHRWQQKQKQGDRADRENLEGFGLCMINSDKERGVAVVMDIVLLSDEYDSEEEDEDGKGEGFQKERHLTPLEQTLDQSINAANTVLREMRYMEKRESRMRQTADSINSRVRWFSYLSVGVLLTVTYVQVTYLKRYFRKKKLM